MNIDELEITSDGKTLLSACTAQITALGQNGKPLGKLWPYQLLPTAYSGSPETPWGGVTVSADGHIYVAAHECPDVPGGVPAHLYSIQADGTSAPGWPISSRAMYWAPAIGSDGTIYQMDEYNSVNAYSPDGTLLWSLGLPGFSQGPIALDEADNLYIGTDGPTYGGSSFFSINPSGVIRNNWPQDTGGVGAQTAAAVDANGHIFITNYAGALYGFNADGSTIAGFPFSSGGTVSQQPLALSTAGILYLKTSVGLFAVNSAGASVWKAPFNPGGDASLSPSPIVDSDGAIYVAFGDKVYSLDPNGSVRPGWPVTVPKAGAMALAQAGVLYVVSTGQQLYSIGNASTAPGTISVSTNLSSAKFTITGPKALSGSGTNETFANVPPGTYTITYTAVAGYGTPPAQTKTLTSGQEIAFAGTYKPHISGVSTILPEQTQTITITGTGFGTHTAYTGDSAFIKVSDVSRGWNAGYSGDPGSDKITLIVNSWTDTSIVLGGFAGNYGPGPNSLKAGDKISIQVWNAETGQGPSISNVLVSSSIDGEPFLTFPLKGWLSGVDQHLTSHTAPVNTVFDHSMFDSATGEYNIYKCDYSVVAMTGLEASQYNPSKVFSSSTCNAGYSIGQKLTNINLLLLPDMNYAGGGDSKRLYYDGHPGVDFESHMKNQVYAAISGKVHYPATIVGLGPKTPWYHVMEIVPDGTSSERPGYLIYYLHLFTYPCGIATSVIPCQESASIPSKDPSALEACEKNVNLPLPEGTLVSAGCLIALSGNAGPPSSGFPPHLHFEVHKVVPTAQVSSRFGAKVFDSCVDGIIGAGYDCVPVDPYGWGGGVTKCDSKSGLAVSGDPYLCLSGVSSTTPLWK